ncbi:uncharacterized protein LOC111262066 isoform X2 [Varroa jacobsoni]|uniref:uncharacterized protein LOC111262066 isoform X2 n=1 Tax=Varroa jacobsoni TaxID=62625 RepID=UPI000BF99AB3|nr:uncharacterized protein LOC111262066 isoform X2 [Varroa jacobsoni]
MNEQSDSRRTSTMGASASQAKMSGRGSSPSVTPFRPTPFIRTASGTYVITGCERGPRLVVVNPMHVMTLSRRSLGVKLAQRLQLASQKWFTHVILLSVLMCYCVIGAVFFKIIEGPHEVPIKEDVNLVRNGIIDQMYRNLTRNGCNCSNEDSWKIFALQRMKDYQEQLLIMWKDGVKSSSDKRMWTFWGSMFYCGTVFTTIGRCHQNKSILLWRYHALLLPA